MTRLHNGPTAANRGSADRDSEQIPERNKKWEIQAMADTGENRQITSRANAKEGDTVWESAKIIAQELSAGRANSAAFVRSPREARGTAPRPRRCRARVRKLWIVRNQPRPRLSDSDHQNS